MTFFLLRIACRDLVMMTVIIILINFNVEYLQFNWIIIYLIKKLPLDIKIELK